MPGLPGLLLQRACSLSGLNAACEHARACRQACTPVANVVFLLSQHDCRVSCWAHVESRCLISLVGWDRCNHLVFLETCQIQLKLSTANAGIALHMAVIKGCVGSVLMTDQSLKVHNSSSRQRHAELRCPAEMHVHDP